ncbi:shadow of prion protein [Cololabis saira]|uniref:shadow of prion protein n=1 Tax=Cololabis saira TaxID=129043 RepID=UPI002AD2B7AF|nr:shadow of prion protein [Cololabis saira]
MWGMKQVLAACWTALLLSCLLWEPALCKGGRGGSRGSSRGSSSRSSAAGTYRGGYGGPSSRSRFRAAGRTSPVRVAAAAAAGAAVALTADKWYASAYRRSNTDGSDEEPDYFNRTNYFDALMSSSTQNGSLMSPVVSIIIAIFSPKHGLFLTEEY